MEGKFKIGDFATFILTGQKVMIVDILVHEKDKVFTAPYNGYLVRFDTLQETPVRELELEEFKNDVADTDG